MTLKEFYEKVGGDYDSAMGRFRAEEKIAKFLKFVPSDPSFNELKENLEKQNYPEAFRAVHTLKGVCLNFDFTRLKDSASALTESLRDGSAKPDTQELYEAVERDYTDLIEALKEFLA